MRPLAALAALAVLTALSPRAAAPPARHASASFTARLDDGVRARIARPSGTTRLIVRTAGDVSPDALLAAAGGSLVRLLTGGFAARVPDTSLAALAAHPGVLALSVDRPVRGAFAGPAAVSGARWLHSQAGLDGAGIGVAIIDSGLAPHDDLPASSLAHWADFVSGQSAAYDDYGHGTHVAGIIAGRGTDSGGALAGVAPGVRLVVLKALDASGNGVTSDIVAALDYAVANRDRFNIRVINLSVAAGVYESFATDPLTVAARRAVEAGIVVVAAAGNRGVGMLGDAQRGGITAPGNAPWVLTVGASTGEGRAAAFSSRGPAALDHAAKPDLLAPGTGIEAAADPASALFALHPAARVWGTVRTVSPPYLRLSGTSMAAAVVSGAAALLLQAEPTLTPNAVKGILQFTALPSASDSLDAQGAGTLNIRGAVALARAFAGLGGEPSATARIAGDTRGWARHLLWGDAVVSGTTLRRDGNAWEPAVAWGASTTAQGEPITWGAFCAGLEAACAAARPAAATPVLFFEAPDRPGEVRPLAFSAEEPGR